MNRLGSWLRQLWEMFWVPYELDEDEEYETFW